MTKARADTVLPRPARNMASVSRAGLFGLKLAFLTPAAVILIIFIAYPLGRSLQLSLYDVNLLRPDKGSFVGLMNFVNLFNRGEFWDSFLITIIYTVTTVLIAYGAGLGCALLLNRKFHFQGLARVLLVLPWAIPEVVAVMVFKWMFDAQFGIVNHVLLKLHIISESIAFLSDPRYSQIIVIISTAWLEYPLACLIILAGLQTVPKEALEAAEIDGAGPWSRFRFVVFPSLRFVNIVVLVLLSLDTFRRTTLIYTMTGGGPGGATMTLPVLTYVKAFNNYALGMASAIGVAILFILALAVVAVLGRKFKAER